MRSARDSLGKSMMSRTTAASVMKAMIRMSAPQLGHRSGNTA